MRILLSSLLMLLVGCASYTVKNGFSPSAENPVQNINPYFSDTSKDYVYKAKIEAFDKTFGGILAIKKIGQSHHRLAFTTEMGNTLFDFTFRNGTFKVNRILKELDKKLLINILKRDFLALITENPKSIKMFEKGAKMLQNGLILNKKHYYLLENGRLAQIIRTGNGKVKVAHHFSGINDTSAENIVIEHENIKLKITLNAIN